MSRIKHYYATSQPNDLEDRELYGKPALPISNNAADRDVSSDDESIAVKRYLASVSREAKFGPMAVVSDIQATTSYPAVSETPTTRLKRDYVSLLNEDPIKSARFDLFTTLRERLLQSSSPEPEHREFDFSTPPVTEVLLEADHVSICRGIGRLAQVSPSTIHVSSSPGLLWLFALLCVLPTPLLADTAADLQKMRRACERQSHCEEAEVLAAVIAIVFGQR